MLLSDLDALVDVAGVGFAAAALQRELAARPPTPDGLRAKAPPNSDFPTPFVLLSAAVAGASFGDAGDTAGLDGVSFVGAKRKAEVGARALRRPNADDDGD